MPISLTVHGNVLYALNAGGAGNISGFDVSGHRLAPLPGSTQPLGPGSSGPAQISFTADGGTLVVTEKTSSTIDTYSVDHHGIANPATVHNSAGGTPFGFDIDRRGHLIVSEAAGSASSYDLGRDGQVDPISAAVSTNGQAAPCWLVVSEDSRFAYTANAGSGTISGYNVGRDGSLTLRDADGITANLGTGSHPLDEAITSDGDFLYNLTDGQHAITALAIGPDGSLTPAASVTGLPVGAAGLAVD
jgi:6-phosphogluconolactonase (cycloisomerase 2 family)